MKNVFVSSLVALLIGCASNRDPYAGLRATQVDAERAESAYWLSQDPTDSTQGDDFMALWRAARGATRDASYEIDRADFRSGVMTTFPLISKQFFEVWRNDVVTPPALAESSAATVRRTVRWDIEKLDNNRFVATPKVLVERYASEERRITSAAQYREIYSVERSFGSRQMDLGRYGAEDYWYVAGRDRPLEKHLAEQVRKTLARR